MIIHLPESPVSLARPQIVNVVTFDPPYVINEDALDAFIAHFGWVS